MFLLILIFLGFLKALCHWNFMSKNCQTKLVIFKWIQDVAAAPEHTALMTEQQNLAKPIPINKELKVTFFIFTRYRYLVT